MRSLFQFRLHRQRGTTLVLLAVFIVALFAFAALSIDVSNVLHQQRNLQAGTDAAAFSAAALFGGEPPSSDAQIIAEAMAIASANRVTTNEIAASNFGTIQVGRWTGTTLAVGETPRNAVRVPARRNVALIFGGILGMSEMNPATHSIAGVRGRGCVTNSLPFFVNVNQLADKLPGTSMALNDSGTQESTGSGKWGKFNIRKASPYNPGTWRSDMTPAGWPYETCVGEYELIPGNAQIPQAFDQLGIGSRFTMGVASNVTTGGRITAQIVGFVTVRLEYFSGSGHNWTGNVLFLEEKLEGPPGGSCPPPCNQTRGLLQ